MCFDLGGFRRPAPRRWSGACGSTGRSTRQRRRASPDCGTRHAGSHGGDGEVSAYQQGNRTAGVVAVLLLLGLFVATGVLAHLSPSPIRTPPSVLPSMERSG